MWYFEDKIASKEWWTSELTGKSLHRTSLKSQNNAAADIVRAIFFLLWFSRKNQRTNNWTRDCMKNESFIQIYINSKCYQSELTCSEFVLFHGIVNLTANNWFHSYFGRLLTAQRIYCFICLFTFRFVVASPVLLAWAHVASSLVRVVFSLYI